jgi:hypothetical protein
MTISATQLSSARKEIAFVDTAVADWQTLADGIRPGVEIILLDGGRDGLAQMAEWAQSHSGYDAIHVLSHGSEAVLQLGAQRVDPSSLTDAGMQAQLAALGQALTADGDLLLYGCSVASGEAGQAFIANLAAATGADVAASEDLTGAEWLGGDWEQEQTQGTIEAQSLEISDFSSVLPTGDEWATHGTAITQDMMLSVGAAFLTNGGKAAAYLKQVGGDSQTWDPTGPFYNAQIDVINASSLITKTIDVKADLLSGRTTDIANLKLAELKNGGFVASWIESDNQVYYAIFDNTGTTDGSHLLSSNASKETLIYSGLSEGVSR